MKCLRVSAVTDRRVHLILPVRMACVTFVHLSNITVSYPGALVEECSIAVREPRVTPTVVPPGGTALFQRSRFAGTYEFCKRNNYFGQKLALQKTLHGASWTNVPDDLLLWNDAAEEGHKTMWMVLVPDARAAAHQFHKNFPRVSSMCVSWCTWTLRWPRVTHQVRKVNWFLKSLVDFSGSWGMQWACGSSCSGRAAVPLWALTVHGRCSRICSCKQEFI